MKTSSKSINNPKTIDALKHLDEMYINAKEAICNGNPIILIQTIDLGNQYLNQDLFNEVTNDVIGGFYQYSSKMLNKLKR